jgi:hypothetical protein
MSSRLHINRPDVRDYGVLGTYDGEVVVNCQLPCRHKLARGMVPAVAGLRRYIAVAIEETHHIPDAAAVGVGARHISAVIAVDCRMYLGLYLVRFVD